MVSILLIGLSLSMDAFAIAVANGLTIKPFRVRYAVWMGLYFGAFQFLMPCLGCLLGGTVSTLLSAFGPYISFFLLSFIGGKMLLDARQSAAPVGALTLSHRRLLALAVATSIDALAVGLSFAFMDIALIPSCLLIGLTTFTLSFGGSLLASYLPGLPLRDAGALGGGVLMLMGLKLLLEGLSGG